MILLSLLWAAHLSVTLGEAGGIAATITVPTSAERTKIFVEEDEGQEDLADHAADLFSPDSLAVSSAFSSVAENLIRNDEDIASKVHAALAEASSTSGAISLKRLLAIGDFDRFNQLFTNARINIPNQVVKQWIVFADLVIKTRGLFCSDLTIGDIIINYNKESNQRVVFRVDVREVDLACWSDYDYEYGAIRGSGSFFARTDNNEATTSIALVSSDFNLEPPSSAVVESCSAVIRVVDLSTSGDIISTVANVFKGLIKGVIEREVSNGTYILCLIPSYLH